jgi:hypothetical protein
MKRHIDLEKAAHAENLGALAVSAQRKHRRDAPAGRLFTAAQSRALSDLSRLMFELAMDAGADHKRVTLRGVSFELQQNGVEKILSIRTAAAS